MLFCLPDGGCYKGTSARLSRLSLRRPREPEKQSLTPFPKRIYLYLVVRETGGRDCPLRAWPVLVLTYTKTVFRLGAYFLKSDPSRRPQQRWDCPTAAYKHVLEVRITVTGYLPSFRVPSESKNSLWSLAKDHLVD